MDRSTTGTLNRNTIRESYNHAQYLTVVTGDYAGGVDYLMSWLEKWWVNLFSSCVRKRSVPI
ncbi:hypothetical protein KCP76_16640 [Salmonella enterica subsp. enterica serovar Weltevreden]|nr:hypothetical protein KCP76_16640 [Salmonella enterica subsp. enterica serovar Weltevreden]